MEHTLLLRIGKELILNVYFIILIVYILSDLLILFSKCCSGKCCKCNEFLEVNYLNDDEFKQLRDVFLDSVVIGKDMFRNTTPTEFTEFMKCIRENSPFDIVIDALNVFYVGTKRIPPYTKVPTFFS